MGLGRSRSCSLSLIPQTWVRAKGLGLILEIVARWYHVYLCRPVCFSNQDDPVLLPSLKNVVSVAAGACYSAAVTDEGLLFTWGKGSYGRLGHGEWIYTGCVYWGAGWWVCVLR